MARSFTRVLKGRMKPRLWKSATLRSYTFSAGLRFCCVLFLPILVSASIHAETFLSRDGDLAEISSLEVETSRWRVRRSWGLESVNGGYGVAGTQHH